MKQRITVLRTAPRQDRNRLRSLIALHPIASAQPPKYSHTLPFVTPASNVGQPGFVRIINRNNRAGAVRILAYDDTGRRFGPVTLLLAARQTRHFSSRELEQGGNRQSTGLSRGVGNGAGNWRLELATNLVIEPLAYIRRADGFLTSMHEVAAETRAGSRRYDVPFFNPARDRRNVSILRLINPGRVNANIAITGVDDRGRAQPGGPFRLTMRAGTARMLTAQQLEHPGGNGRPDAGTAPMLTEQQLEQGDSGFSSRFGAGSGRWQLLVFSNRPILVMSLLRSPTGYLANLSRGQAASSVGGPTPPPPNRPDLVVRNPTASINNPRAGQSIRFTTTVFNQGRLRSAATTLRYYRSTDATISTRDTRIGTDSVRALNPSSSSMESIDFNVPSTAGTYYYGACVDIVSGESNANNNCSSAVRVTVGTAPRTRWGAMAAGWVAGPNDCSEGFGWTYRINDSTQALAQAGAVSFCRSQGWFSCTAVVAFRQCGAIAYARTGNNRCVIVGSFGATRSAAEQAAISRCRNAGYANCTTPTSSSGQRASYCNAGFQTAPRAEEQSGITGDLLVGASKPGPHSQEHIDIGEGVVEDAGTSIK